MLLLDVVCTRTAVEVCISSIFVWDEQPRIIFLFRPTTDFFWCRSAALSVVRLVRLWVTFMANQRPELENTICCNIQTPPIRTVYSAYHA